MQAAIQLQICQVTWEFIFLSLASCLHHTSEKVNVSYLPPVLQSQNNETPTAKSRLKKKKVLEIILK